MTDLVRLFAQCHCTSQTFHVDVLRTNLPLPRSMCHCDDCRHITGLLSTDCVVLPSTQKDLFDHDHAIPKGLSVYRKKNGIINWYFCQECGAHIVQYDHSTKRWLISTGLLHPLELDDGIKTIKMVMHSFVKYGRDQGGMTQWLPDGLPRYIDVDKIVAEKDGKESTKEEKEAIGKAISAPVMPMTCHCGHVQINIHRPSSKPLAKEWESCNVNDAWLWTFCLCNSCRTTSGFDANCFLFAPYTHITNVAADTAAAAAKSTIKSRHATDGLRVYISYPGRRRHFCPTCGACVFFDRDDRGDLSDVFLGLADIPLAAMFSSWVHKAKKLSFYQFARNKELAACLVEGFCPTIDMTSPPAKPSEAIAEYDGTLKV